MIVTDDEALAKKAKHLTTQAKSDPFEYMHDEIGYNYRLPNINAALGCAQLEQLGTFLEAKRELFRQLEAVVGDDCLLATSQSPASPDPLRAAALFPTGLRCSSVEGVNLLPRCALP